MEWFREQKENKHGGKYRGKSEARLPTQITYFETSNILKCLPIPETCDFHDFALQGLKYKITKLWPSWYEILICAY